MGCGTIDSAPRQLAPVVQHLPPPRVDRLIADRDGLFDFQHRDGRTKLIERLAAAYRANDLPDYMRDFVESLRSRASR
jgi:hypothetical protein